MMLTLEEKLRVAAMYIGAPVSFFNPVTKVWSPYRKLTPSGLVLVGIGNTDWKLKLTVLGNITDEHAYRILAIVSTHSEGIRCNADYVRKWIWEYVKDHRVSQYLTQLCYAIPLYFCIDHLENNKTAIELGLAEENHSL